jgi:hypothetical protein
MSFLSIVVHRLCLRYAGVVMRRPILTACALSSLSAVRLVLKWLCRSFRLYLYAASTDRFSHDDFLPEALSFSFKKTVIRKCIQCNDRVVIRVKSIKVRCVSAIERLWRTKASKCNLHLIGIYSV